MDLTSKTLMMGSAGAVGGESYWIAELNASNYIYVNAVTSDSAGNIYATGSYRLVNSDRLYVVKYSPSGALLWQKELPTTNGTGGNGVSTDTAGNVYVAGYSYATGSTIPLVVKYTSEGTLVWQKSITVSAVGAAYDVSVDSSGNVYVLATWNASNRNAWHKLNSSGTLLATLIESSSTDNLVPAAIISTSNGTTYTTTTVKPFSGTNEIYIAKRDSSFVNQWERRLYTTNADTGRGLAVDGSENVYLEGLSFNNTINAYVSVIAKYNSSGVIQWQKHLSTTFGTGSGKGVAATSTGTVFSVLNYSISKEAIVYCRDTSGTLQWQRKLTRSSNSTLGLTCCTLPSTTSVAAAGNTYTDAFTPSTYRGIIAKLPSDGSKTGTYGVYTYAASSLTDGTSTLTDGTYNISGTNTATVTNSTLTDSFSDLSSSIITI